MKCVDMVSRRKDIRILLLDYFSSLEYDSNIEQCLNHYIVIRQLDSLFLLKKGEIKTSITTSTKERLHLRDQIAQELSSLKQKGLIKRRRYGIYY